MCDSINRPREGEGNMWGRAERGWAAVLTPPSASVRPSLLLPSRPRTHTCVSRLWDTPASACVSGRLSLLLPRPQLVHGEVLLQTPRWRWRASAARPAAAGEAALSSDRRRRGWRRRRKRRWRRRCRRKKGGEDENISAIQVGEERQNRQEMSKTEISSLD